MFAATRRASAHTVADPNCQKSTVDTPLSVNGAWQPHHQPHALTPSTPARRYGVRGCPNTVDRVRVQRVRHTSSPHDCATPNARSGACVLRARVATDPFTLTNAPMQTQIARAATLLVRVRLRAAYHIAPHHDPGPHAPGSLSSAWVVRHALASNGLGSSQGALNIQGCGHGAFE